MANGYPELAPQSIGTFPVSTESIPVSLRHLLGRAVSVGRLLACRPVGGGSCVPVMGCLYSVSVGVIESGV